MSTSSIHQRLVPDADNAGALEAALVKPDAVVDSLGDVPGFLARNS